jgi:hypothetical protein
MKILLNCYKLKFVNSKDGENAGNAVGLRGQVN